MTSKNPAPDRLFALGKEAATTLSDQTIIFKHGDHQWQYLDRAFCIADREGLKFAIISRRDPARPITDNEKNTRLTVRKYGDVDWDAIPTSSFEDALAKASYHADRYKAQYLSEWLRDGTDDMPLTQKTVVRQFENELNRPHNMDD